MSTTEHKVVYRVPIPELRGRSSAEALAYFRARLGEPRVLDGYTVEDEDLDLDLYWRYGYSVYDDENPKGPREFIVAVERYGHYEWAVDLVLAHRLGDDIRGTKGLRPGYLYGAPLSTDGLGEILTKHGFPCDGELRTYSWYNGGDEPISIYED